MRTSSRAWSERLVLLAWLAIAGCDDAATPGPVEDALVSGGAQGFDFGALVDMAAPDAAPPPPDMRLEPDMCWPDCRAAVCGPDGCGGVCGTCDPGRRCSAGTCLVEGCPGDDRRCGADCVDVTRDVDHCGGCEKACVAPEGGRTRCDDGACVAICVAADGAPVEVDPQTDRLHCGACGVACEGACLEGQCVPADCRAVVQRVATCLVESDDCPAVVDPAPILEEGVYICTAPGLFSIVREALANQDCDAIVELVGEALCLRDPDAP